MITHPYLELGEGLPPAPIVPIVITPPDWANNSTTYEIEAFLDTGSDCTLVPIEVISILQLRLTQSNVSISGVGGGQILGLACYVNLQLAQQFHKAIKVYGCPREQLGNRVLVGRNILNQCCIQFDGRNLRIHFISEDEE
jgi:Retroviral aspartyl protease